MKPDRLKRDSWFRSKWFLGAVLGVFFLSSLALAKELVRSYQINRDIDRLKTEITSLQSENHELANFVEFLKTDRYFEEQARLKFSLKEPGEKVLVLREEAGAGEEAVLGAATALTIEQQKVSNASKWLSYFFGV